MEVVQGFADRLLSLPYSVDLGCKIHGFHIIDEVDADKFLIVACETPDN